MQALIKESEIRSYVVLLHGFPSHIGVRQHPRGQSADLLVAERVLYRLQLTGVRIVTYTRLITRQSVSGTQFEVREPEGFFEPMLLAHTPRQCHGGEVSPAVFFRKTTRAVGTERSGQQITVVIAVRHTSHEGQQCPIGFITIEGWFQQTVAELARVLRDKTLNGSAHELIVIRLHGRTDHGREIMLVIECLDERKRIIPKPCDALVERPEDLRFRLGNRLPVVRGCPTLCIPIHHLHTKGGFEDHPVHRFDLRVDITQEVIPFGSAGIHLHLSDGVGDIAYVHSQAYRTGPRTVFVINSLRRQCAHSVLDIILASGLDVMIQAQFMT